MLDKLTAIEAKYSQIEARLAAPETYDDPAQVAKLNKEQSELQLSLIHIWERNRSILPRAPGTLEFLWCITARTKRRRKWC